MKIDIDDDGAVSICGTDKAAMDKAVQLIQTIVTDFEEGMILTGKVVSIKEFGAFLEFAPGKEGMVHISKIAKAPHQPRGGCADPGRRRQGRVPGQGQDGPLQLQYQGSEGKSVKFK